MTRCTATTADTKRVEGVSRHARKLEVVGEPKLLIRIVVVGGLSHGADLDTVTSTMSLGVARVLQSADSVSERVRDIADIRLREIVAVDTEAAHSTQASVVGA